MRDANLYAADWFSGEVLVRYLRAFSGNLTVGEFQKRFGEKLGLEFESMECESSIHDFYVSLEVSDGS